MGMPKLTLFERQIIESGRRSGKSVRAIAKSLGRDHRVIQREVNRNTPEHGQYLANIAERLTDQREDLWQGPHSSDTLSHSV